MPLLSYLWDSMSTAPARFTNTAVVFHFRLGMMRISKMKFSFFMTLHRVPVSSNVHNNQTRTEFSCSAFVRSTQVTEVVAEATDTIYIIPCCVYGCEQRANSSASSIPVQSMPMQLLAELHHQGAFAWKMEGRQTGRTVAKRDLPLVLYENGFRAHHVRCAFQPYDGLIGFWLLENSWKGSE